MRNFPEPKQTISISSLQGISGVHVEIIDGQKPYETTLPVTHPIIPDSENLHVAVTDPCYERFNLQVDRKIVPIITRFPTP